MVQSSKKMILITNLIPLIGVMYYHWGVFDILFLYWLESVVSGIKYAGLFLVPSAQEKHASAAGIGLGVFFCLHYGLFMSVHLFFLKVLFGQSVFNQSLSEHNLDENGLVFLLLPLVVNQVVDFIKLAKEKRQHATVVDVKSLFTPYKRLFVMQGTIIFSGLLISLTGIGHSVYVVAILGCLKIFMDIYVQKKYHNPTM